VTSHKLILLVCQQCRFVMHFYDKRSIWDFDSSSRFTTLRHRHSRVRAAVPGEPGYRHGGNPESPASSVNGEPGCLVRLQTFGHTCTFPLRPPPCRRAVGALRGLLGAL
jgi:hypothetical protein